MGYAKNTVIIRTLERAIRSLENQQKKRKIRFLEVEENLLELKESRRKALLIWNNFKRKK